MEICILGMFCIISRRFIDSFLGFSALPQGFQLCFGPYQLCLGLSQPCLVAVFNSVCQSRGFLLTTKQGHKVRMTFLVSL